MKKRKNENGMIEVEIDAHFDPLHIQKSVNCQIIDNVVADVNTAFLKRIVNEKALDLKTYVGSNSSQYEWNFLMYCNWRELPEGRTKEVFGALWKFFFCVTS
jgi:hypothetical protein